MGKKTKSDYSLGGGNNEEVNDDTYWTEDRMKAAQPIPLPQLTDSELRKQVSHSKPQEEPQTHSNTIEGQ